jgi:hypothetical protein
LERLFKVGVNSKQIQEITSEAIVYIDDDGSERFLDFTECFNTFLKWTLATPTTTERMAQWARESKRVGEITWAEYADAEDIEFSVVFYDNRVTYFDFPDGDACYAFEQKIADAGWTLYDTTD